MGSCTSRLTDRNHIQTKSQKDGRDFKTVLNRPTTMRKGLKQKAAVVDSRLSDNSYSEAPNAVIQDLPKTEQEVRLILNSLSKHFIFSTLKPEYKGIMVHHMKHYFLNPIEKIFEQGQPGNNFYVVASGKLEVIVNSRQVAQLKPGDSFGEMALIHDTLRTATIQTLDKSSLWGLDRKTFRNTLELLESVNYEENKLFIETISIFETLTPNQKESLVHAVSTQYFNPSTRIIKEGEPGELLYIVKEGNVLCTRGELEIRRLGKGSYFGEQALLYNEMRTATVTAIDRVKCVAISGQKLNKVLGSQLQSIIYQNSIRIALEKNHFMRKLTKEQIDALIINLKIKTFTDRAVIIASGMLKKSHMWIIVKGSIMKESQDIIAKVFDIISAESMIKSLEGVFESNLLAGGDTDIAFITQTEFNLLLGGNYSEITHKNEALKVLKRVQILQSLDIATLNSIMSAMQELAYKDGDIIVEQNDLGDSFFIVKSGIVEILRDGQNLRTITKHDYFGERSLIFNDFRSATVKAKGPVCCWTLIRSEFMELLGDQVTKQLLRRIGLQDDSITLDDLTAVKLLGSGMFGNVFLTVHKTKKLLYALKTVDRRKIAAYEIHDSIVLERRVLMQLDHVFIMKLVRTFKDSSRLYFLLEFINGTDLFEVMRKLNLISEQDSRFYTACIIEILEHLHDRQIIYRDLKPENIVVDEEGYPRLIDFGTAKFVKGRTFTIVGTPHYMAPEIISGNGYGLNVDFWSLGIMLYEFLFGMVPFGEDEEEPYGIYQKVQERKLEFPGWMEKNSKTRAIITQLLSKNPPKRIGGSIENLKNHTWFSGFEWDKLIARKLKAPYLPPEKKINDIEELIRANKSMDEIIAKVEAADDIPLPRKRNTRITEDWDREF